MKYTNKILNKEMFLRVMWKKKKKNFWLYEKKT